MSGCLVLPPRIESERVLNRHPHPPPENSENKNIINKSGKILGSSKRVEAKVSLRVWSVLRTFCLKLPSQVAFKLPLILKVSYVIWF